MALSQREIQARKDKILSITIEQYIHSVTPVSSQLIAEKYHADVSSATIRNVLAELEEEGLLTHPHTSAGRIPTQVGYRYYVDHLMSEIKMLENEKKRIKEEIAREELEVEELLDKTSQILSETTHYTSIISVDGWDKKIFCCGTNFVVDYPEYQDINKISQILRALEQKRDLLEIINRNIQKRINIFIGQEIAHQSISHCSLVVSEYKTRKGPSGRIAVLGPTRMDYERVISTLDYFSDLMEEIL